MKIKHKKYGMILESDTLELYSMQRIYADSKTYFCDSIDNWVEVNDDGADKVINPCIYIRGVKERGEEVIKTLTDVGGKNLWNLDGDCERSVYVIDLSGYIIRIIDEKDCAKWIKEHYTEVLLPKKYIPKDKELVWFWNDYSVLCKQLGFYDAKNKSIFWPIGGKRNGMRFDDCEPYVGEYPKWAIELQKGLED